MPLDPDIRRQYPDNWSELRRDVLDRAVGQGPLDQLEVLALSPTLRTVLRDLYDGPSPACERCGVPQGRDVLRHDGLWTLDELDLAERLWFNQSGEPVTTDDRDGGLPARGDADEVEVLLSVAHQCQDPRCDNLDHLMALCRRCHMQLDFQPEHFYTRKLLYAELRGQQRLECCREPGCSTITG